MGIVIRGLYHNFFCGQAAVIVFFVISGFCIHYPFRKSLKVPLKAFWAQRFLRIGVPLAVALPLAVWWNAGALLAPADSFVFTREGVNQQSGQGVVWSLICELIYYAIYPALLWMRTRWGWPAVIALATVVAVLLLAAFPEAKDFPGLGNGMTWIVGLPTWLIGCLLAEICDAQTGKEPPSKHQVWLWRSTMLAASVVASAIRFHPPFGISFNGLGWSLNLFAWLCVPWIKSEIAFARANPPPDWLERLGTGSYSLYVFHVLGLALVSKYVVPIMGDSGWQWIVGFVAILVGSWIFYLLIERPSHWMARKAGRQLLARVSE